MTIWKTLSSKIVDENPFHTYRIDEFERSDGSRGKYHYIEKLPCCIVVPVTHDDQFLLVHPYRYLQKQRSWEFPMGASEAGETPEEGARRECIEETGYDAKEFTLIGEFEVAPGTVAQKAFVYLGRKLFSSDAFQPDEHEGRLPQKTVTQARFQDMIRAGEITDSLTLAAYLLYLSHVQS
ncbi:MAG: NUDIX hydrolase [Candidatus Kerfeldbacteria bacterium]|nr:NUDIX hydrolase [Candidatus Kerfeldbacteria bacterium]